MKRCGQVKRRKFIERQVRERASLVVFLVLRLLDDSPMLLWLAMFVEYFELLGHTPIGGEGKRAVRSVNSLTGSLEVFQIQRSTNPEHR